MPECVSFHTVEPAIKPAAFVRAAPSRRMTSALEQYAACGALSGGLGLTLFLLNVRGEGREREREPGVINSSCSFNPRPGCKWNGESRRKKRRRRGGEEEEELLSCG